MSSSTEAVESYVGRVSDLIGLTGHGRAVLADCFDSTESARRRAANEFYTATREKMAARPHDEKYAEEVAKCLGLTAHGEKLLKACCRQREITSRREAYRLFQTAVRARMWCKDRLYIVWCDEEGDFFAVDEYNGRTGRVTDIEIDRTDMAVAYKDALHGEEYTNEELSRIVLDAHCVKCEVDEEGNVTSPEHEVDMSMCCFPGISPSNMILRYWGEKLCKNGLL